MTATYHIADLHLGHKNVHNFRKQFSSAEEHDEIILQNFAKTIRPNDTVWLYGDIAFTLEALAQVKKLPGKKHLILGNHDKSPDRKEISIHHLIDVYEDIHGFLRKYNYWLSHCPIHPDELRGRRNICGHSHNHIIADPNYLNVCAENIDFTPISLEQINSIFKERGF